MLRFVAELVHITTRSVRRVKPTGWWTLTTELESLKEVFDFLAETAATAAT
jgi:hypothetical protein